MTEFSLPGDHTVQKGARLVVTERGRVSSAEIFMNEELPCPVGAEVHFTIEGYSGKASVTAMGPGGTRLLVNGRVHGL
jgi:hypothetical protein